MSLELLDPRRLITVGEVISAKNADIEDLFSVDDYVELFNAATGKKLKAAELPPGDRIVKRIAEKDGGDFDHGIPADYLLRNRDTVLAGLSPDTLDRFESLVTRINATRPA